jgi:hypothetical protein
MGVISINRNRRVDYDHAMIISNVSVLFIRWCVLFGVLVASGGFFIFGRAILYFITYLLVLLS